MQLRDEAPVIFQLWGNKCITVRYLYSKARWNNDKVRRLGDTVHITKYIKSNRFYSRLFKSRYLLLERVDVEPTGDAFNSIIRLEIHKPGKPFNPMINAGAITIASLLPGTSVQEKLESIYVLLKNDREASAINEIVFQSEWETAHRNRALAYYLKENGFLESDVEETLEVYLKQCSIEINTEDIALIGLILAHDGYHPIRKEQVLPKEVARLTKALMLTCGMYNASGKFAAFIGLPAKSGVSGGIMTLVPQNLGRIYRSKMDVVLVFTDQPLMSMGIVYQELCC